MVAVISPEPWSLRFDDGAGRTLLAQQHDDVDVSGEPWSLPFGGTVLADGELAYHVSFEARPDEQFYGLGERFGTFGQRGTRSVAWIEDALGVSGPHVYKAVPYYWSTRGYGLFVNSGPRSRSTWPPPRTRPCRWSCPTRCWSSTWSGRPGRRTRWPRCGH